MGRPCRGGRPSWRERLSFFLEARPGQARLQLSLDGGRWRADRFRLARAKFYSSSSIHLLRVRWGPSHLTSPTHHPHTHLLFRTLSPSFSLLSPSSFPIPLRFPRPVCLLVNSCPPHLTHEKNALPPQRSTPPPHTYAASFLPHRSPAQPPPTKNPALLALHFFSLHLTRQTGRRWPWLSYRDDQDLPSC